jgi:deoxyribonuclease V
VTPRWPRHDAPTPTEAAALQDRWRERVLRERTFGEPRTVAGVDTGIRGERARGAVVVLSWPELQEVDRAVAEQPVRFPYVPGLLGFREVPCLLEAFERLRALPDVALVDGQGLAHPRRFGVACHLGVALDLPTVGVGKSRLVGAHREPGQRRGSRVRLVHDGEVIGVVLRTREGVKPVYVSIGHRVDLDTAVRLVLRSTRRFRLPEPIRAAHHAASVER